MTQIKDLSDEDLLKAYYDNLKNVFDNPKATYGLYELNEQLNIVNEIIERGL